MTSILDIAEVRQFSKDPGGLRHFFRADDIGVSVTLRPVDRAYIIWVNLALARFDPKFQELRGNIDEYRRHLLSSCGYRVAVENEGGPCSVDGFADRYGGRGLEGNGGAGRAVYLNGYYVKGIGPTSLLGERDDGAHASGDAYLEEAVRETIYAEIFAAEFPHSAVRTLAIIGVGEKTRWDADNKEESLVLMVRPAFLRIGHFARALGFRSTTDRSGTLDRQRVLTAFDFVAKKRDPKRVFQWLSTLRLRIAEQMAYSFAHRLTQGSPTLSNWCVDGRVLDFGASTALPGYTKTVLAHNGSAISYARGASGVLNELSDVFLYAEEAFPDFEAYRAELMNSTGAMVARYQSVVVRELLRICAAHQGERRIEKLQHKEVETAIHRVLRAEDVRGADIFDVAHGATSFRTPLEIVHDALSSCKGVNLADSSATWASEPCLGLPNSLGRPSLYRESTRAVLYELVDPLAEKSCRNTIPAVSEQVVTSTIAEWVARNRRDARIKTDGQDCGFAVSNSRSLLLFTLPGKTEIFGKEERPVTAIDGPAVKTLTQWLEIDPGLRLEIR